MMICRLMQEECIFPPPDSTPYPPEMSAPKESTYILPEHCYSLRSWMAETLPPRKETPDQIKILPRCSQGASRQIYIHPHICAAILRLNVWSCGA